MNWKKFCAFTVVTVGTALIVGCGDQRDPRLSDSDIYYLKQQKINQMYGIGTNGTTSTVTSVQFVTVTNVNTVTVQQ